MNTNIEKNWEAITSTEYFYQFLTNLYTFCSKHFVEIIKIKYDFMPDIDFKKISDKKYFFIEKLNEKIKFFSGDSFHSSSFGFFKLKDCKNFEDFALDCYLILLALDELFMQNNGNEDYIAKTKPKEVKSSEYFDSYTYIVYVKPKNHIYQKIVEITSADDQIRGGTELGQRLSDRLSFFNIINKQPVYDLQFNFLPDKLNKDLDKVKDCLTIGLSPITCNYDYNFIPDYRRENELLYNFSEIKNEDSIWNKIQQILEFCRDDANHIHIIIFPELSVNASLRQKISEYLREKNEDKKILLIVAGSYHEKIKESSFPVNSCVVFQYDGQPLWKQCKMNYYTITESELNDIKKSNKKGFENFKAMINENTKHASEKIQCSKTLQIMDSSLFRMAVTICCDFFAKPIPELINDSNTNFVIVPSMTNSFAHFNEVCRNLGDYAKVSVFLSNNCWFNCGGDPTEIKSDLMSFYYLPMKNAKENMRCENKDVCIMKINISEKIKYFSEKNT